MVPNYSLTRDTTTFSNNFTEALPNWIQWQSILYSLNCSRSSGRFTCDEYKTKSL